MKREHCLFKEFGIFTHTLVFGASIAACTAGDPTGDSAGTTGQMSAGANTDSEQSTGSTESTESTGSTTASTEGSTSTASTSEGTGDSSTSSGETSSSGAESSTGEENTSTGDTGEDIGDLAPDGLAAAFTFNEESGDMAPDITGNGHDATVSGLYSWEEGTLHQHLEGEEFGWTSIPRGSLLDGDWTIQLWFAPHSHANSHHARALSASDGLGGTGPEFFYQGGNFLGFRINGDAVWNEPSVGTRSNAGPPDHWAIPAEPMQMDVITDLTIVHEVAAHRLQMYQSSANDGAPELIFDGTYVGDYEMVVDDLRLGRTHQEAHARPLDAGFDQLLIYDRTLSKDEIDHNHAVGPL